MPADPQAATCVDEPLRELRQLTAALGLPGVGRRATAESLLATIEARNHAERYVASREFVIAIEDFEQAALSKAGASGTSNLHERPAHSPGSLALVERERPRLAERRIRIHTPERR